MLVFDKTEIKNLLDIEDIYALLAEWGGQPEYTENGIISRTICHNDPRTDDPSRKLYYYSNANLFYCYSGCAEPSFDIFQLVIKVFQIQFNKILDLNDAVRYIAAKFGFGGRYEEAEGSKIEDWEILSNYERIQSIEISGKQRITLKEYNPVILDRFNYSLKLTPWLNEDISQEVLDKARIGFYPGGDQITIPHFDAGNRFIGLRGRALCQEDSKLYGKYRPLKINQILYSHPLGLNLYNLNNSKNNIALMEKAIIFEGEKSSLKYASFFGIENDISVACCGSSVSAYQMQLLIEHGAKEIIIALDRQFQEINDDEYKKLKTKLIKLNNKYKNYINISIIFDKNMITGYKSSPIDEGKEKFLQLFKERIIL